MARASMRASANTACVGSGTTEESTGPVLPAQPTTVGPHSMSATKMFPLAFAVSSPATVALVTVNVSEVIFGALPPLQSLATVHSTDAVKVPVPSACTGAKLVNPTSPPAGVVGEL